MNMNMWGVASTLVTDEEFCLAMVGITDFPPFSPRYFLPSGEPGCLIGAACKRLGVWGLAEGKSARSQAALQGLSKEVLNAANAAQRMQDRGYTWGECLDNFRTLTPKAQKRLKHKRQEQEQKKLVLAA